MDPAVSSKLADVVIVGMRHYDDAFDRLFAASEREIRNQHLFLVRDVNNKFDKNAVMLHDGEKKLGYVAASQALAVRKIIDKLTQENGSRDQVVVVKHGKIANRANFSRGSSTTVTAVGYVHERIARKFVHEGE